MRKASIAPLFMERVALLMAGNPGAGRVMCELADYCQDHLFPGAYASLVANLEIAKVKGSDIWVQYRDVNNEDIAQFALFAKNPVDVIRD